MITLEQRGQKQNWNTLKLFGKSTDTKPTHEVKGEKIGNASTFYEMDTKKLFMYDEETHDWIPQ